MGQTLGEPITTKETSSCEDALYRVGSSAMQGWRINMEDSHTHLLALPDDKNAAFFAVYDGHGGAKVSQYVSRHLHKRVVNNEFYAKGELSEAMKHAFLGLDEQMLEDEETKEDMSGTTAITVLIKNSTIFCANVGDSRAIASVTGQALPLSFDHKPCNDEESRRIIAAGGWVEFNRVNGNLALSRALGDFGFKRNENKSAQEQVVTAYPEVLEFQITAQFEFLVVACDGIWDVLSNQEVVDFCRERLATGKLPEKVCEELLDKCLSPDCEMSGLGCDNMTAIIVCLLQNEPQDKFLERLRAPQPKVCSASSPLVEDTTEEQMAELGLKSSSELTAGSDLPPIDTEQHSSEEYITPSQSPSGHNSTTTSQDKEHCSDDEPPANFFVNEDSTAAENPAVSGSDITTASPEVKATTTKQPSKHSTS